MRPGRRSRLRPAASPAGTGPWIAWAAYSVTRGAAGPAGASLRMLVPAIVFLPGVGG